LSARNPSGRRFLTRFADAFAVSGFRPEAFHPCYGLAESTLFVTGGVKGVSPAVCSVNPITLGEDRVATVESVAGRKLVSCGRATPEAKVLIVDPERCVQREPGEIGEVWIASASVARGYHARPEESVSVFGARLADTGEGPFLRTGDLGFLHNGELFITGRLKNIIIVGGRNHYAEDIERTMENCHPALRPGCCAAFSVDLDGEERLVIAAELERRPALAQEQSPVAVQALVETIRRAVSELHDLKAHSVLMLRPAAFPRTTIVSCSASGAARQRTFPQTSVFTTFLKSRRERRQTPSQFRARVRTLATGNSTGGQLDWRGTFQTSAFESTRPLVFTWNVLLRCRLPFWRS
jgi:acyl-CoA synthetase (AMP-forming)/AMP-acid ligase II